MYWWAYLALRSHPALQRLGREAGTAILFDDPARLPSSIAASQPVPGRQFFYILWDGYLDATRLRQTRSVLGQQAPLTLLVVGEPGRISESLPAGLGIGPLFVEGELLFTVPLRLDGRTRAILAGSRLRNLLMPAKNLVGGRLAALRAGVDLLLGSRRLVFCGSYGITPQVLQQLCARHDVEKHLLEGYSFLPAQLPAQLEALCANLDSNGAFLAALYRSHAINEAFFNSALQLLGRQYVLGRIAGQGWSLFANGYASGRNINVYTTPWYRQHVFLDFGSAVGPGNYPRLADLRYFRKTTVAIELLPDPPHAVQEALAGQLSSYFETRWLHYTADLQQLLA